MHHFPVLHTERLQVRCLKPADLEDFYFYRSNPEVTRYQGFDVYTLEQARTFIREQQEKTFGLPGQWVQYGIENKSTGRLIGDCAIKLDQKDPRIGEIGITVAHTEQKKGYAKEAIYAILTYLFSIDTFHRVTATTDADNAASIQLLKSLGFRQEGHFIENIFFKGKWSSELQFALLKKEWDAFKEQPPRQIQLP